jgi:Tol biopolymer transport system component
VPSLYVARTDGSILRRLDGGFLPQWTPGGRILYLGWTGSYNDGTQTGVFTIDVGGRTRRRLSKTLVYGKLSPDGKMMAVSCGKPRVRSPGASPVQPNLCAEPLDGSRPHVIARLGLPLLEFDWSPGDRQLAMIYQDGRIAVASLRTHSARVRIVARMRNPVASGLPIVWSPDGRRFAYTDFALNAAGYYVPELYVVTIKTRQARFLTARAGTTVNVRWSSPTTLTYLALGTS